MRPVELLELLAGVLERLALPYLITGSMASTAYGEPRFTNDIDVVVALPEARIAELCSAFPADAYYVSEAAAREAVRSGSQFNILHPASGLKIDVMIATTSEFDRSRLARGRRLPAVPRQDVVFASPEDVILKKLIEYREGGSEKHLRDITGMLLVQGSALDRSYLQLWADKLAVGDLWQTVLERTNAS